MIFNISPAGIITPALQYTSPNQGPRPEGAVISLLVIHNISLPPGQFGTGAVQQFFMNTLDHTADPSFEEIRSLQVSSHCLIERDGQLTQFVSCNARAWHAGESTFEGESNCNNFSIGIELEGTDNSGYTEEQYSVLGSLTKALMLHYPAITRSRIVGHCDIAPKRKTDPGSSFDWSYFYTHC